MEESTNKLHVSKLSAARRQLDSAIEMWFSEKDPVAIHTLAAAAYQIIHDVHEKRLPGKGLFLNHEIIKPEMRAEFSGLFKEAGNFFKHADRDADGIIEFVPFLSVIFLIYSTVGLNDLGEQMNTTESALFSWLALHHPELVSPKFVELMNDTIPKKYLGIFKATKKREFLKLALEAAASLRIG